MKKLFIKSYGCQMNVYDSDRIKNLFEAQGYSKTSNYDDADLIVLNTCHIREKAAEKVYSDIGRIAKKKSSKKEDNYKLLKQVKIILLNPVYIEFQIQKQLMLSYLLRHSFLFSTS